MPDARRRDLHPGAWWSWALLLAACVSMTTNVVLLAMFGAAACVVVAARRTDAPWALAFRQYLYVAAAILLMRVAMRTLFSGGVEVADAALAGFADGLRLAVMVVCVGAANSLASPKRLLAVLPAALHEAGTSVVIALSVFPQLAESSRRVARARRLRGDRGRWRSLHQLLVPVLEDAFDRSIDLAASMDARGYGRSGSATEADRRRTGAFLVLGLVGLCIGMYAILDSTTPRMLGVPMLVVGVLLAGLGLRAAGRRVVRTRYRRDRWHAPELLVVAGGAAAFAAVLGAARIDPAALHPVPDLGSVPAIPLLGLVSALCALLPAWVAPEPAEATA